MIVFMPLVPIVSLSVVTSGLDLLELSLGIFSLWNGFTRHQLLQLMIVLDRPQVRTVLGLQSPSRNAHIFAPWQYDLETQFHPSSFSDCVKVFIGTSKILQYLRFVGLL